MGPAMGAASEWDICTQIVSSFQMRSGPHRDLADTPLARSTSAGHQYGKVGRRREAVQAAVSVTTSRIGTDRLTL